VKLNIFTRWLFAAVVGLSSLPAHAQTITLTNGVQKYAALANATVNMSGRCELWVTNASPLSGCAINLNSSDAWLFLPGVKPSVAAAAYLGQVKVNGSAALADSNVRVVQYGQNGAVVIPQPSSFQPLTVFTGAEFNGAATSYSQWTYYTGAGISNISSFKLKRGYQAVLAQSANGVNYSKCYIAQDGDLEIGVLPATLDKQVQFIYVTLWRWTDKKGIANNPPLSWLNVNWWYDWNIDQSSSRDLEYVAIKQQPNWPGLSQNWQSLGINTVLGYNEPDNSSQDAYNNLTPPGSVTNAVGRWSDLLATGLRIGSPATTDAGRSGWLYPFVSQADAAGYRVDFVAIHYYWAWNPADPSGAANQMYNFLLDIWNNTHRPIWITEWNNGANWTDNNPYPVPTYAQQQACIAAMMQMLENTPFVERYALYNWVEDNRSLVTSSNTVTLAGTVYSNLVSNLSYSQAMPDNGTRGIAEFLFATNTWDTSGYYNNGMAVGAPNTTAGHNSQAQAMALDGANSYLQLPANIASGGGFTFAAWVWWNGGAAWQRIFDFGNDTSQYLFLTPDSGGTTLRFAINNGSGEQIVERSGALASGSWQHVAITLNGSTAILYVNGTAVATNSSVSIAPSAFSPIKNYLGKSQFPADPLFNGKLDEVEIGDYAMTPAQIFALYASAPYPAYTGGVWTNDADGNWSAGGNWSGGMIANGGGFIADFSTLNTMADRTVTLDSARTIGGLRFGNSSGSQNWILTGANTLTLDAGGANPPTIAVNQNTATISTALAGSSGFTKTGGGTLTLNGNNTVGGGLSVNAGSVNITGGATAFGNVVSYVGYLTGSSNLTVSNANLTMGGELRVAGSDQSGSAFNARGTVSLTNAVLSLGALTLARGNYLDNSVSGTLTVNSGSTVVSTNDAIVEFAGTGRGKLVLNGGNFIVGPTATKWLMVGYYDSGAGELDNYGGNLLLENNTSLKMCRSGNTGGNVINQFGGNVTFYSDAGVTTGGGGNLDLNYAGAASSSSTYNLNGGALTVPQVIASTSTGSSRFNFNGGTLKPAANNAAFLQGLTAANVRNGGAIIDTAGFNVTISQVLRHSIISGDNATDGGLTKQGNGKLTLSAANSYTGNTTVNAGTLELELATLAANSTVSVANGAGLQLDFASTNQIGALVLNGVAQLPGIYNSNTVPACIAGAGSLSVSPGTFTNAPVITNFAMNGLDLVITGTNGQAGCAYYLLGSGDLTLPLSRWQTVATNVLNADGGFAFTGTNVMTAGNQQEFYILSNTNR
jgi:autotransporter-associated beta strand protein